MPIPIKYAVASGHSLTASSTVSAALVTDGGVESLTPSGKLRIGTIKCALTAGTHLSEGGDVVLYLSSDSAGNNPITPRMSTKYAKVTGNAGSMVSGFAADLDVHTIVTGSVYVVCKLPSSDSATGAWTLFFVQGG